MAPESPRLVILWRSPLTTWPTSPDRNSQAAVHNPEVGLQTALGMEDVSGLPEFFQHMHQVEDQCDLQLMVDPDLESAFAVGQCHAGFQGGRVSVAVGNTLASMFPLL